MQRVYSQKEQYAESELVPFAEGYLAEVDWMVRQLSKIALDLPAILVVKIRTNFPATTSVTTGYRSA